MYFKLGYTIRDLTLPKEELMSFEVKGLHEVHVEIRAPSDEEQQRGHNISHAFSTAYMEDEPSTENNEIFKKIEENKILNPDDNWRQKYKGPDGKEIALPLLDDFPNYFRSFIDQVHKELSDASKLVINVLRWRINHLGPHQPISSRGTFWSRDKNFWHSAPSSFSISVTDISPTTHISDKAKNDIIHLVSKKTQEPIYHELFRVAWGYSLQAKKHQEQGN